MSTIGSSDDDGITTVSRSAPAEETELYCPACDNSFNDALVHCPHDGTRLVRLSDVRDPLIGRNLEGRFLIKERLGTGGMGAVYRAWQGSVGREVAVKVIESRLKGGRLAAKRFLREAKLASRLSHANTVSVIDFGQTDDGLLYLVMELVKGRTMTDVMLEDGQFSVDRMARVGIQLCDALEAAHKLSIIHRDLKPSNIILLEDPPGRDHIKVLDFGLAKSLVDEGSTTVTQSDAIMGTPSYIPPEAVTRMQFDERSDLYSLGVILYEVLAGRLPFDATTVQAMLRQHAFDQPRPLPDNVPPDAVDLLCRLLEKEPDRRPQTAAAVRQELAALSGIPDHGTPIPRSVPRMATPLGGVPVAAAPSALVQTHISGTSFDNTIALPRRRGPWIVLALIGLALSVTAILIATGAFKSDDDIPAPAAAAAPATTPATTPATPPVESPGGATEPTPTPVDMVELDVTSEPPGAEIYMDGAKVGTSPTRVKTPRGDQPVAVELRRDGFRTRTEMVVPDQELTPVSATLERRPPKTVARTPRTSKQTKTKTGTGTGTGTKTTPTKQPESKPPPVFTTKGKDSNK